MDDAHRCLAVPTPCTADAASTPDDMHSSAEDCLYSTVVPERRISAPVRRGAIVALADARIALNTIALLDAIDIDSRTGVRDRAQLLVLYNTGARVSEVVALRLEDLRLHGPCPQVKLLGKGRKRRSCPLWLRDRRGTRCLPAGTQSQGSDHRTGVPQRQRQSHHPLRYPLHHP